MKIELISPNDVIYMTKESQKELVRQHYNHYTNIIFDNLNNLLRRWSSEENYKEYNYFDLSYPIITSDTTASDRNLLIELISEALIDKGWKVDYEVNSINLAKLKIYRPNYKPWYKKLFR